MDTIKKAEEFVSNKTERQLKLIIEYGRKNEKRHSGLIEACASARLIEIIGEEKFQQYCNKPLFA